MRDFCFRCHKAAATCYCKRLRPFSSEPVFAILTHPRELRNPVGTGRMLSLSLQNSIWIDGHDFTHDPRVNGLIADPALLCRVLYPGRQSLNLSACTRQEAHSAVPAGKRLVVFVIDGTWGLARGMINRSANLRGLPQLSFTPERPSGFGGVRRQPERHCLSTLESVHWLIERFAALGLYPPPADGGHHGLLDVFYAMVRQQREFAAGGPGRSARKKTGNPASPGVISLPS